MKTLAMILSLGTLNGKGYCPLPFYLIRYVSYKFISLVDRCLLGTFF